MRSWRKTAFVAGAIGVLSLVAASARAAPSSEDKKAAATHYKAGASAFEAGDNAAAIQELEESVKVAATARAYLLLGSAYVKVGRLDDARTALEHYLELEPRSRMRGTIQKMLDDLAVRAVTRLQIASTPPGAKVYIDLRAEGVRGQTPLDLPIEPGNHRVIFELDGYEPLVVNAVATSAMVVPVHAQLKPRGCDLAVSANAGATVKVDAGAPVTLPATVRVTPGAHQLELAASGLVTRSRAVECVDFKPQTIAETLEAPAVGTLVVRAPDDAHVAVDGKALSSREARGLELPPGEHHVTVDAAGRVPWQGSASVRAGERTEIAPELRLAALAQAAPPPRPVYKRAWFWGVIAGVVAVGAATAITLAVLNAGPSLPTTDFGPISLTH